MHIDTDLCYIIGKTVILEAAVQILSQEEDTEILFFMALGETLNHFPLDIQIFTNFIFVF